MLSAGTSAAGMLRISTTLRLPVAGGGEAPATGSAAAKPAAGALEDVPVAGMLAGQSLRRGAPLRAEQALVWARRICGGAELASTGSVVRLN